MEKEIKGDKQYRFKNNPEEELFHNLFIEHFRYDDNFSENLSKIVFRTYNDTIPTDYVTKREQTICINLIQWLGSPVGQGFLKDAGYVKKKYGKTVNII